MAIKYFLSYNQLPEANRTELEAHLESGYKHILDRKNSDGSLSFKGSHRLESIWLTSYVVKCLGQVSDVVKTTNFNISEALSFLEGQQIPDSFEQPEMRGSFTEFGSEVKGNIVLTALVAISFLENSKHFPGHQTVVNKALNFIDQNIRLLTTNYELAVVAYAFSLAKHKHSDSFLSSLKRNAKVVDNMKYWEVNFDGDASGNSADKMKIASYVILAYLQAGDETEVLPVFTWVVEQIKQNDGAFLNRDSIVTVQALSAVAKTFFSAEVNIDLLLSYQGKFLKIHVDRSNAMKQIVLDFPQNTRDISVYANGSGFALLELPIRYNTVIEEFHESFSLYVTVKPTESEDRLHLVICTEKKVDDEDETDEYGQPIRAVMEVELPSG